MNEDNRNVNNLRILAVDMIENAKSGHPGIALGSAPILYSLYSKVLNVIPEDPNHLLRDRFILSAGHGSSIYYAMLHAFGYNISMEDLKKFRKNGSITPGHPEFNLVPGVDASTGPLGQGVSMAVGMAIAERWMASRFNKADLTLFDNYTYTLVGEGCLMEGVSFEALSIAAALKLNKLIVLYDSNNITLDGDIKGVMNCNILAYMRSLGFNTLEVENGNDVDAITQAITLAKQSKDKPSFIKINTHIGFGSVLQDSNKAHGSCLGEDNVKLLREVLGVQAGKFELEKEVQRDLVFLKKRFSTIAKNLKEKLKVYSRAYPGEYKVLQTYLKGNFNVIDNLVAELNLDMQMSGRDMGGVVLQELSKAYTNMVAGSADVFSSTKAVIKDSSYFNDSFRGRNLKYGIREFAMGCISNGLALYGGIIPINSTFLVFSDYMKSALRMSSLMGQKTISVFTHDSIAVGEDGATHQPCEQIWGLRSIPNMNVFRPANWAETKASYALALSNNNPSCIILSRQKLVAPESSYNDAKLGGYIISKEDKGALNGLLVATGSEVGLAIEIQSKLKNMGYNIRVVSMPCLEIFESQSEKYKNTIIPNDLKSVFTIEAGSTIGWYKYAGKYGRCYGVDDFGGSATPDDLFEKFNLTSEYITKDIIKTIKKNADK